MNIRQHLSTCIMNSSWRIIQEMFLSLAVEWEQVEQLCYHLIDQKATEGGTTKRSQQSVREEVDMLFIDAGSVGELLYSPYGVLFGDLSIHDKPIGGDKLCAFTLNYIKDNYSLPLNIQTICAKTGFSQTYLSRLLRKYADTSVNTYLTQCRMDAAKKLFKENPTMLPRDVEMMVGYESILF